MTAVDDGRLLALDIEGALRVGGWIGLLQVGVGDKAYVFDTIYADAIMALVAPPHAWGVPPLAVHLGDDSIVKILHAGSGDVAALYAIYGICVRNIFDTCCADMILRGDRGPRGLGTVLEEWAGVARPEKASFVHTDTIWRERPLSWHSLSYAAADVTHLAATYLAMQQAARSFDIINCLTYYSMRLPASTSTPVFVMPMQGDELLVRSGEASSTVQLIQTTVEDKLLRLPQPLEIQQAGLAIWQEVFGEVLHGKSEVIKCKHIGKCQRVGQFFILQPAVTLGDERMLPQGMCTLQINELTSGDLRGRFGLSSMECAAIEWCKYTAARDADLLPALPPDISIARTARGGMAVAAMSAGALEASSVFADGDGQAPARKAVSGASTAADTAQTAVGASPASCTQAPAPRMHADTSVFIADTRAAQAVASASLEASSIVSWPEEMSSGTLASGGGTMTSTPAAQTASAASGAPLAHAPPPSGRDSTLPVAGNALVAQSLASSLETSFVVLDGNGHSPCDITGTASATPAASILQQGRGAGEQPTLAALQPRADAASFAAVIVRDDERALVMKSYALERQPGESRTTIAGWVFPRLRMHSGFKGSVVARQALENVLGPFERLSAGGNDGMRRLVYLGRVSDTMYYEAYVHNLTENRVALFAAWRQRAATPSIEDNWTGFDLCTLNTLKTQVSRSDDSMAAGMVLAYALPAKATAKEAGTTSAQLAHLGRAHAETSCTTTSTAETSSLGTTDALRHLAAIEVATRPQVSEPEVLNDKLKTAALSSEESLARNLQQGTADLPALTAEQMTALMDARRKETEALHAQADRLRDALPAWAAAEGLCDAPPEPTAETALLQAVADEAAKAAAKVKLDPPTTAPQEDPTLGNDDDTNVARTRVPGWAPEITQAILRREQANDEYISTLKLLAAPTGLVKRNDSEGTFELVDDILYRIEKHGAQGSQTRRQVVVPATLRGAFMRAYHDRMGHLGVKRVLAILRERAWWIGVRRDVRAYIRRCPTCALTKLTRIQAGQARSIGNGDHPGDVWTYDILDIDSALRKKFTTKVASSGEQHELESLDDLYHPHKLLVFIDRFSRWAEAFPLEKDPTADEVLDIFVNEIVKRHGYPRAMTCDRGANLMQGSVREYYDACGIQLLANDSYMHNTAGLVERFNGTLKDILKGFLQDVDEDADCIGARWWRYLTYALLSYNTSEATATGYSPFYLMYGRDARMPLQNTLLPIPTGEAMTYSEHVAQHLRVLHDTWEAAQQQTAAAASASRQEQNLSRDVNFNLKPGDRVLIRKPNLQGLEVPYAGPFRVAQVLEDDRVQLRDLHRVMHDEFHISILKLYPYVDNDGNIAADREEYIIKDIRDHRQIGGENEYLVKWEGYRDSYNTWVPESEFNEHALEVIQAYWQRIASGSPSSRGDGITRSTVEKEPISKAPAFRSHRKDQLEAAPADFASEDQVAPEAAISRVDKKKSKDKKQQKAAPTAPPSSQTTAAEAASAAPAAAAAASPLEPATGDVSEPPPVIPQVERPSASTRSSIKKKVSWASNSASASSTQAPSSASSVAAGEAAASPLPTSPTASPTALIASGEAADSTTPTTSLADRPSASTRAAKKKKAASSQPPAAAPS